MQNLPPLLITALAASPFIKYGLITLVALLEGPVLFVVSGFLLRIGVLDLIPLFLALMAGDLIGDVLWYSLGFFFARKAIATRGKFLGVTQEHVEKTEAIFAKHQNWVLFTSKATLGFGTSAGTLAVLIAAGIGRVPFLRFMVLNIIGEVVLLAIMLGLGYAFGASYQSVSKDFRIAFLVGISLLLIAGAFLMQNYLKKRARND